ncbi:PepSY-associated TM helix domain-containing protein [Corynebacterium diphtheriae]
MVATYTPSAEKQEASTRALPRHLRRLHFFAGIICAPLIFIASLTGLGYAFGPSLDKAVYSEAINVTPSGDELPLERIVDIAHATHPDLELAGVRVGNPDQATRVMFNDPTLPKSTTQAVFVNQYTGDITGDMPQYGGSAALPIRHWLSLGHRDLWLGEPGRLYSETAASWLGVLAVSGVYLWWKRQRKAGRLAAMLRIDGRGRTRNLRWHGAIGTLVAAGMIFLTITGLTWSSVAGDNIRSVRTALNWTTPSVSTALGAAAEQTPADPHAEHGGHSGHHAHMAALDVSEQAQRVATTAAGELRTPFTVKPPKEDGHAWTAAEDRVAYRLTYDALAVDGSNGQVTDRVDFEQWSLPAKLTAWLIELHMGTLLGVPNQIALGLLAIGLLILVVRGYLLWFQRRGTAWVGSAPARSVDGVRGYGALGWIGVAAMVIYGVVAPLFGITCVAFLICSMLWDVARRRR